MINSGERCHMSPEQLAEIRETVNKATPGPWTLTADRQSIIQTHHITRDVWIIPRVDADTDLIAHAPEWLTELLAMVESQEQELIKLSNGVITLAASELAYERRWAALREYVSYPSTSACGDDFDKGLGSAFRGVMAKMRELEGKPL